MTHILIVDDDAAFSTATAKLLKKQQCTVSTATTLEQAREQLQQQPPEILLLDVMLPDGSGLDLLQDIASDSDIRIVMMTAHPTLDIAIDSLRSRVADFLIKPIELQQLLATLQRLRRAMERSQPIVPSTGVKPAFEQFVGNSPAMLRVYKLIDRVASSDASVLIRGASGTGKELVAQALHNRSERHAQPFLSINCGAVSKELIGSELFGHEKGSFTGAARQHQGYFERANGGTLFLDEVTEMPLELQVQLLRVLETGKLVRLGGDKEIAVNVRIVAATNRFPQEAIKEGLLREDLYFRLAVFPIEMPSLADREGDISLLAEFFLQRLNRDKPDNTPKRFSAEASRWLEQHPWTGNVRELQNTVQRAFIMADEEITPEYFPASPEPSTVAKTAVSVSDEGLNVPVGTPIDEVERQLIQMTLKKYKGDKPKTAETLGISLKTLYNRLNQYENDTSSGSDRETGF